MTNPFDNFDVSNLERLKDRTSHLKNLMQESQEKIVSNTIIGEADNGRVKITMAGNFAVQEIYIDSSLLAPDKKIELEKLIVAAFNDAISKAGSLAQEELMKILGGAT